MPQLGETVAEGKITKWFKSAGDDVKPGDNLFEIETDKTSMEVPSTVAGKLSAINVQVGEVAKVGAVVAVIGGAGDAAAAAPAPAAPPKAAQPAVPPPAAAPVEPAPALAARPYQSPRASSQRVLSQRASVPFAERDPFNAVMTPERNFGAAQIGGVSVTPLARRLAGERSIDLTRISGSGPHGRIVARDVEQAAPSAAVPALSSGPNAAQVAALYADVPYEEVPVDGMRAIIARRLVESKQQVPHFYLTTDLDISRLTAVRQEVNAALGDDAKLSLNDFIIKAWAVALTRVPQANAVWAQDRILRFSRADVGVAVALDEGVITPVIRDVQAKTVSTVSAEMRDFAERARARKLAPNDYQGGSSAISNLGMYGVREFAAVINPPHATILAVGASRRAPVEAEDGSVRFTTLMTVTLSCDHRVLDGAVGAKLLQQFKTTVETPILFLV